MSPWWTQAWIDHWGTPLFHGVFWPLTVLGVRGTPAALRAADRVQTVARLGVATLGIGIALGLSLLAAAVTALALHQPFHVWERLVLYGSLFVVIHGTLLIAQALTRRRVSPAHTGDSP